MLKTNSKQTRAKIKNYIVESAQDCDYIKGATFEKVAPQIARAFYNEKIAHNCNKKEVLKSIFNTFVDWCQGLPSAINCDYYYNISAVELLGDILEQTPSEKERYTEEQSERVLTLLIFRELANYIDIEIMKNN